MPSYQIFIPGVHGASPELLRAAGLGDVLDPDFGPTSIDVLANGPGGQTGIVFYWHDFEHPERNPAAAGYHPESQDWAPCKARKATGREAGAFWLGRDKDRPVLPEDLARRKQLGSLPVKLRDGNEWLIPIAKCLPHKIELDDEGEPVRRIMGRYSLFHAEARKYFDLVAGYRSGEPILIRDAFSFAVECLYLNYRVNRDVVDFLELLTEENVLWIIGATAEIDQLQAIDAQKKKAL